MNRIRKPLSWMALSGLGLGVGAIAAAVISGLGYRLGWWHQSTGFLVFEWAVYGALTAFALSVAGLFMTRPSGRRRGFVLGLIGAPLVLPIIVIAVQWEYAAQSLPRVNDVTTDPADPPDFWNVPNPDAYAGLDLAAQTRSVYSDLKPLEFPMTPEDAFEQALSVAKNIGWEIIAVEAEDGRIEATDSTFLYGFKDDVVVRVISSNGGTRVDVRSHSRIGRIDRGANAQRIRGFLDALKRQVAAIRE